MRKLGAISTALLGLVHGGLAVSYTRDPGDTGWSVLSQWNDNRSGSYQDATNFPASSDTILLNGGRVLSVDTNAFVSLMKLPNATSDAYLELFTADVTLTVSSLHVGNNTQGGNGTVDQRLGTVDASTLSLRPSGTASGFYNLSGGSIIAGHLEIGNTGTAATGTAVFVQSGGSVVANDMVIGGSGSGSYEISGGTLEIIGNTEIKSTGQLKVDGSAGMASLDSLSVSSGGVLSFDLNKSGASTLQVNGPLDLSNVSIHVDGSAFWEDDVSVTLIEASSIAAMPNAGNITISGLVDAAVSQSGNDVVLKIVASKKTVMFENNTGDGCWNTAANWSSGTVPSGTDLARIEGGMKVTVATTPPAVDAIIVGSNALLSIQAPFSMTELRCEAQGQLELSLPMVDVSTLLVAHAITLGNGAQVAVDGADYEGLRGCFALMDVESLSGDSGWIDRMTFSGLEERAPAAFLQDGDLMLRLTAPPPLSDRVCSMVPESTVAGSYSDTVFSATRALVPSGSAWGTTLHEGYVMDTWLSQHAASSNQCWELRVGRGGQIASFRTPALGETVPPSYSSPANKSPWMDEVWQGVSIDTALNGTVDDSPYFIHQAGVYPYKDPALDHPFYSPMVAAAINAQERSFTTINWGQHAHLQVYTNAYTEDDWRSDLLYMTRFRDLGEGVIEVSLGFYNYGNDMPNYFNMPWGGVRRTSLEYAFFSEPGGVGWTDYLPASFGEGASYTYANTGGTIAFSASTNGASPCLGLVFGQDPDPLLDNQTSTSLMRYGYAGNGTFYSGEADWRNYYVISAVRKYNLSQGRGVWARYYYVLGDDLTDLESRIASRNLAAAATLTEFDYSEESSPLMGYSFTGSGNDFRVEVNNAAPQMRLYAHPIPGSFPIYELIEDDETRYLSWDPYATGMIKTYDGSISGIKLLGFALRSADANSSGRKYDYVAMEEVLTGEQAINYIASGEELVARTGGLSGHWALNETAGLIASDSSANQHDASVSGAVWSSGFGGGSLKFNGGTDSVAIPSVAFDNINNEISIAMWAWGDGTQPLADSCFYAKNDANDRILNIHLPFSNGIVYWDAGFSTTYDRINKSADALDYQAQWNHWVFTKDATAGTMEMYLNGSLWHSGTGKTRSISGITSAAFGGQIGSGGYTGKLDDVRLYDVALTAQEIADLYNGYQLTNGVPVDWLPAHGLLRTDEEAMADSDADGLKNWEEYIAGLNPTNYSPFVVSDYTLGDATSFTWDAVSGRVYQVYWSSNLVDGFRLVATNVTTGSFEEEMRPAEDTGFYKISVELE